MSETNNTAKLNVDIVSDVVCPWCYVGLRHLDEAMARLPNIEFDLRWRPFQLNPDMPKEGMDRAEYMAKKFGKGTPTENFYKDLENLGKTLDIDFAFEKIEFAPNTLDAHRLIHWASGGAIDSPASQTTLVRRLFEAYFENGKNVGDPQLLSKIATELGMNHDLVTELLASDRDVEAIGEQLGVAANMGITGVPCFIVENKYAVMGAQKPEALVDAFEKAYAEKLTQNST